jgi:tripartite-type tricarboxylate transporter receptor subunit TctC
MRCVLNSPEVREQYAVNGLIAMGSSSADFAACMRSKIARWAPVIRATGARVD